MVRSLRRMKSCFHVFLLLFAATSCWLVTHELSDAGQSGQDRPSNRQNRFLPEAWRPLTFSEPGTQLFAFPRLEMSYCSKTPYLYHIQGTLQYCSKATPKKANLPDILSSAQPIYASTARIPSRQFNSSTISRDKSTLSTFQTLPSQPAKTPASSFQSKWKMDGTTHGSRLSKTRQV